MRQLTQQEQQNIKILTQHSVSFTLIEPTATALQKGIIDATGTVRSYLRKAGAHDYNLQGTGAKENGVIIPARLYFEQNSIKLDTSLYRPKAKGKGGDPRIWFSRLHKYVNPSDILAIIYFDNTIQLINITRLSLDDIISPNVANPINELIEAVSKSEHSVSEELLAKLKEIAAMGYLKSLVNHDTGVGRTLEHLLGIPMNSKKTPDYKGIELKAFRSNKNTRKGLFGKTPNWKLSKLKSRVEILDEFGYWEKGVFRLYNTIRGTGRNAQGLILKIDHKKDWLIENSDRKHIGDFLIWELEVLRNSLLRKHKETFWIETDSKFEDGNEYFKYKAVEHTKNPMVSQLETLLENGIITLDYPIKREDDGSVIDKGCNFKLKRTSSGLLFPPSSNYNLLN